MNRRREPPETRLLLRGELRTRLHVLDALTRDTKIELRALEDHMLALGELSEEELTPYP